MSACLLFSALTTEFTHLTTFDDSGQTTTDDLSLSLFYSHKKNWKNKGFFNKTIELTLLTLNAAFLAFTVLFVLILSLSHSFSPTDEQYTKIVMTGRLWKFLPKKTLNNSRYIYVDLHCQPIYYYHNVNLPYY